jgi:hypothetical protein
MSLRDSINHEKRFLLREKAGARQEPPGKNFSERLFGHQRNLEMAQREKKRFPGAGYRSEAEKKFKAIGIGRR